MSLLEVSDLHTEYRLRRGLTGWIKGAPRAVRAVDGVDLSVDVGELLALVGESGSGKTTTAQTILRLIDSNAGRIHFDGEDITGAGVRRLTALRRRIQVVYQDPYESLDPRFTVRRALEEPLLIHGIGSGSADRLKRVHEALERVDLTPAALYAERLPHELSGGQRQRVAIAVSLVVEPELLIADEPVSMLDVSVRAGVLGLLDRLRRDQGLAIVMITHDLATAAQYADRIAVMYLGRIVEHGDARDIVNSPAHPYTQALISVVPGARRSGDRVARILKGEIPNPADLPGGCRFHPRCPVATELCAREDQPLRAAGEAGHEAACIHVGRDLISSGASVTRPTGG